MKILIVHNDYGKYSGEEAVVDRMASMLGSCGMEVAQLRMTSAGSRETVKGKIHGFFAGIYSRKGVKAMREALQREKPDVVNVHNLYPFISPAALKECRKAGVPVVMTVHNFRLICPTGLFMRDGRPCEKCLVKGGEWSCVRHNCEASMLKSVGYAARNAAARWRGDFKRCVTHFACITDFQRRKLIEAGFDESRISVIPNSVQTMAEPAANCQETNMADQEKYVAYCGRLSKEKGIDMIVEVARRNPEIRFKLAGELREPSLVEPLPKNVELVGYLIGSDLINFFEQAAFFVMASRWYEGFPMSILETASYGRPTIGPDHGGFTEIIGKGDEAIGLLFTPGDTDDLEAKVRLLWSDNELRSRLGRRAAEKLRLQYSEEVVARKWTQLLDRLTRDSGRN